MEYVVKKDEVKVLDLLMQVEEVGNSQDKIPVFIIPTVYGSGALVHRSAEQYLVHEKSSALSISIHANCLIYDSDREREADWFLFVNKGVLHRDKISRKYILPIDMEDISEDDAIKTIFFSKDELQRGAAYNIYYEADLCLPEIRWKVTKPGMRCKDMHYEMKKYYTYSDEIRLHKAGYHFANSPHVLSTWYRHFNIINEVYLVQVPSKTDKNHKIILDRKSERGVTNSILFLSQITWEDIKPRS